MSWGSMASMIESLQFVYLRDKFVRSQRAYFNDCKYFLEHRAFYHIGKFGHLSIFIGARWSAPNVIKKYLKIMSWTSGLSNSVTCG